MEFLDILLAAQDFTPKLLKRILLTSASQN